MIIPTPKTMSVTIADIDSEEGAGRNMFGMAFRDRVAIKRKLVCTWAPMYSVAMANLLQKMKGEFFEVTYPDPETGSLRTMTGYVGDRTVEAYRIWTGSQVQWLPLSANIVER